VTGLPGCVSATSARHTRAADELATTSDLKVDIEEKK
jgi:hypothetical protein